MAYRIITNRAREFNREGRRALARRLSKIADKPLGATANGFVVGGGLAFQSGPLKFSPEVRYTRWADPNFRSTNGTFQSNLNQADFLLGIVWSRF